MIKGRLPGKLSHSVSAPLMRLLSGQPGGDYDAGFGGKVEWEASRRVIGGWGYAQDIEGLMAAVAWSKARQARSR